MNATMAWLKTYPATVGAIGLAVCSIVLLVVVNAQSGDFTGRMTKRNNTIRQIKTLRQTRVTVPSEDPQGPEQQLNIAVNQATIEALRDVYNRMTQEYTKLFEQAVERNVHNHTPMDTDLFPKPSDVAKPFNARTLYKKAFEAMTAPHAQDAHYPRLDAGLPPDPSQVKTVLDAVQEDYLKNAFFPSKHINELTDEEVAKLNQRKSAKLLEQLQERAQSIHLYADPNTDSPQYSFDVGLWSKPGPRPSMDQVWEGQIGLWVQQDIAEAIARTNRTDDPGSNVMTAPIKHLLRIRVVPGYVGLLGAKGGLETPADTPSRGRHPIPANPRRPAARPMPRPAGTLDTDPSADFSLSPTGRRSNEIYDVIHVWVSLIADSQQLPDFFNHLQQVNFMTVLMMRISQVDEYKALRQGFVYGSGDVVRADILIETIWLRDWTTRYMPASVRQRLGVPVASSTE